MTRWPDNAMLPALWLLFCWLSCAARVCAADVAPLVTRIIERIPRTPAEVAEAHEKSNLGCVQLPKDIPLVQPSFDQHVYYDVKAPGAAQSLLFDWGRWPIIDYGTRMTAADQKELPFFTSSSILDVIDNTYVCLQARVHRAAPDGVPYLHYLPIAGVGEYIQSKTTTEFAALQQVAVSNVRSLGLFLKTSDRREPQSLRTLVVSIKGTKLIPNEESGELQSIPTLELLFVRMRVDLTRFARSPADAVKLHAFGTIDGLQKLVYFKPYAAPASADDCTIRSTVRITEYSLAGQIPSGRAAREVRINAAKEFTILTLDEYARRNGLAGDAFDNITEILDGIIDGKVK
ncbi:MAG TPA: hypothetical protein VGG64_23005 [Pirellulales bacterium]